MNPTRVVGRRCVAFVVDGLIFSVVSGIILAFVDPNWYQATDGDATLDPMQSMTYTGLLLLFWAVEVLVLEGRFGWTVGKLLLGLRVVRADGQPPGPLRALVRYLLWVVDAFPYCLPLVGFGAMVATPSHRRVGDMAAGTYVIDRVYFSRLILPASDGVRVGEQSVRPQDLGMTAADLRMITRARSKDPTYDKNLDTYVVWNEHEQRFLMFDKSAGAWVPISQ